MCLSFANICSNSNVKSRYDPSKSKEKEPVENEVSTRRKFNYFLSIEVMWLMQFHDRSVLKISL